MTTDAQEQIRRLQGYEQNLQGYMQQKQELQNELLEINSAQKALSDNPEEAFRIIGNLMVKQDPATMRKEIDDKKQELNQKIEALEKQENQIREKATRIRNELMENMNKEG